MKAFSVAVLACLAVCSALVSGQAAYEKSSLSAHNTLRAKHQDTPPMTLDADLNSKAQACAVYYAGKGTIDHTCLTKDGAGENLYMGGGGSTDPAVRTTDAANSFYSEIKDYDFSNPGFSSATGHFSQLVWVDSNKLGVGYVNKGNEHYVVNLYMNPGNYNGAESFELNVKPLK